MFTCIYQSREIIVFVLVAFHEPGLVRFSVRFLRGSVVSPQISAILVGHFTMDHGSLRNSPQNFPITTNNNDYNHDNHNNHNKHTTTTTSNDSNNDNNNDNMYNNNKTNMYNDSYPNLCKGFASFPRTKTSTRKCADT